MSDVKADLENSELNDNTTFDAQQLTEEIDAGEQEAPKANVEADYERAKQYSVPGVEAEDTESNLAASSDNINSNRKVQANATSSGDPQEFRSMAKDVQRNLKDQ